MKKRSESRVKTKTIPVRVSPEEKLKVESLAASCKMSRSSYLLQAGLGITPSSKTDLEAVHALADARSNLGRLGGLLKGWLAGSFSQPAPSLKSHADVLKLLREIEVAQKSVVAAAIKVAGKGNNS